MIYNDLLSSETLSLRQYLNLENGIYTIPFSQRQYEWSRKEVTRLFNDLIAVSQDPDNNHILNFFTFSKNEDRDTLEIFDGQQRTITSMLIIANVLQRIAIDDPSAADQYRDRYVEQIDRMSTSQQQKKRKLLFDSTADCDFFYKITGLSFNSNDNASVLNDKKLIGNQKKLADNYVIISELFDEYLEITKEVSLKEIINSILDHTYLIRLIAESEEIAQSMFETLNNTGRNLEKYYVLKNDFVRVLGENNVRDTWNDIDSNVQEKNRKNFLIAFTTLVYGKYQKNQLVYDTKTSGENVLEHLYYNIDNSKTGDMTALMDNIKLASASFMCICDPSQYANASVNDKNEYSQLINRLSMFNIKQHRPLILAMMMKNIEIGKINFLLRKILSLVVRNIYFREDKGNTVEKPFSQMAFEFYNEQKSFDEICSQIDKLKIKDSSLVSAILDKKIPTSQNRKIAFILSEVYKRKLKGTEVTIKDNSNDLEHILPQNPAHGSQWLKDFPDEEMRNELTFKLGNLTLWDNGTNRSAKNKEFVEKCNYFNNSLLEENKKIACHKHWTEELILKRTKQLAKEIFQVF